MENPLFQFRDIMYKDILKIDHLSIAPKTITALVGKSGAGKSTILKVLNKTISPTGGKVFYEGRDLKEVDSIKHRRQVLYMNQKPYLFEGSIKDNLIIGFDIQEVDPPNDEALNAMLKKVKLNKKLDQKAAHLSGGEAQRLTLARLLLLDAPVYLLDEPSSALDDQSADIIFKAIVDFSVKHQKSLIMITHTKAHAKQFANHIITLDGGRVIKEERNG